MAVGMIAAMVLPSVIGGAISLFQQHKHNQQAKEMAKANEKKEAQMMAILQQEQAQTMSMVNGSVGGYVGPQGGGFGPAGPGAFPPMVA